MMRLNCILHRKTIIRVRITKLYCTLHQKKEGKNLCEILWDGCWRKNPSDDKNGKQWVMFHSTGVYSGMSE